MWREAQGMGRGEHEHPNAPGVTVEEYSDLPHNAVIVEQ